MALLTTELYFFVLKKISYAQWGDLNPYAIHTYFISNTAVTRTAGS